MVNAATANDRMRQADEAYRAQVEETFRQQEQFKASLVDVFAQGLHGFGALKNAAAGFLETLAEMTLKTALLQPILDNLFGGGISPVRSTPMNSAFSGGFFGSILKAVGVPGYANGTNFAPGGLAMVGERGPELVNLPRGSQVIPNVSRRLAGGAAVSISIDARGAQVGVAEQIEARLRAVAPAIVAAAVNQSDRRAAGNMAKAQRDVF